MPRVDIRIRNQEALFEAMAGMRQWLDHRRYEPAIFRSVLKDASLLMRVEFASLAEANEFAYAFDGTIGEIEDFTAGRRLCRPGRMNRLDETIAFLHMAAC